MNHFGPQHLGPDNAFWDDGEWISWDTFGTEFDDQESHLAQLEREAELKLRFPKADISLIPCFQDLLAIAEGYFRVSGKHLQVYGDIGELFGAITYGIALHRNYAPGSDGRLGKDFVEVKTITPFNTHDRVKINLAGNFSKLLVVKVNADFEVSGKMVDRKRLPKSGGQNLNLTWGGITASE